MEINTLSDPTRYAQAIRGLALQAHRTLRFFEIYADEVAYNSRRRSARFKKYAETTKNIIMSRRLIDTVSILRSEKKK